MHGGLERESGAGGRRVKKRGHDAVLVIERTSARHHVLHASRSLEQFHEQGNRELLRLDDMFEWHGTFQQRFRSGELD